MRSQVIQSCYLQTACRAPLLILLLAAAGARADSANAGAPSTANPEIWPRLSSPLASDPALEQRIADLLASMTLEEKVGQVVQGDLGSVTPDDLRRYRLGSVLAGGNSDPGGRYNASASEWLQLADQFYAASMDTSEGGKPIPVLLGIDAVHGHNNVVGATLFPHNIGLGAINDPALVKRIAAATAIELRTTGFEWTFAPTVTVPRDDRWGRTYEGYSEDPALVARYATAVVEGLQGEVGSTQFLDQQHVLASSKHFIGDGGTFEGRDKGDTRVTETELRDVHGAGHIAALKAGTQTVMASFSSWNGEKMHGNHSLLTEVLKNRLGFDGFVVGDWNGHGEVPGCSNSSCAQALNAGIDMYMAPDSWRDIYTSTLAKVRSGEISLARLDDAVTRILRVKFRLGLFEAGAPSKRAVGGQFDQLASPAHRTLAREAVRRSLVLLKNNDDLLPLKPGARVLVAGDGADNIAKQSGGWTLSWQGTGTEVSDFPKAESIWAGIQAVVSAAGGKADLVVDGRFDQRPDVAIVVFGEDPYAEFVGDVPHLGYQTGEQRDLALLRRLQAAGIPVVSVFLTGRPLWVNPEINASDAFVVAWLPGSEGGGVADLLFAEADGRPRFDFSGRLPFSWPSSAVQSPLNAGQPDYQPQFALGYGLNLARSSKLEALSEVSGLLSQEAPGSVFFARGKTMPGWHWWWSETESASAAGQLLASVPARSSAGRISASAIDHLAQEDARRFVWSGQGPATLWLGNESPRDLSALADDQRWLRATLKLNAVPAAEVALGLGQTQLPIGPLLAGLEPHRWVDISVPLACFKQAGADLAKVGTLFALSSSAALDLSVSKVQLGASTDVSLSCESADPK